MAQKSICALSAGFIGALVGNPADLALVRMQTDSSLPENLRRNYKNIFDAFKKIVASEGPLGLWTGAAPTVIRALVLNWAMFAPYDEVKDRLNRVMQPKDSKEIRLM